MTLCRHDIRVLTYQDLQPEKVLINEQHACNHSHGRRLARTIHTQKPNVAGYVMQNSLYVQVCKSEFSPKDLFHEKTEQLALGSASRNMES